MNFQVYLIRNQIIRNSYIIPLNHLDTKSTCKFSKLFDYINVYALNVNKELFMMFA